MDIFCVFCFFFLHCSDWVSWVSCLISVPHSAGLFLSFQCRCLFYKNRNERIVNCWWISFVCLLLPSLSRLSSVSVVFDFSDSLNDVAPVSPMSLSVYVKKKEWFVDGCLVCLLSFAFTVQIEFSECRVWFQCFTQWCCSYVFNHVACLCKEKRKRVNCWWMSFVCILSFVFTTQIEFCECCVWFQWFTQWCCSCVSNLVVCLLMLLKIILLSTSIIKHAGCIFHAWPSKLSSWQGTMFITSATRSIV